jgi:membrane-bound metal-dependent hydrolase YbcI (DUF457 family)
MLRIGHLKARLATACGQYLPQLVLLVLLANLADVDFLIGIAFQGDANALHRGFTHSLAAAVVVALIVSLMWRVAAGFWRSALLYFIAYASHLVIDFWTGSRLGWSSTGSGIPLLWPLSKEEFSSPFVLIVGVIHDNIPALFTVKNARSSLCELLTFGAITILVAALRVRYSRNSTVSLAAAKRQPHPASNSHKVT